MARTKQLPPVNFDLSDPAPTPEQAAVTAYYLKRDVQVFVSVPPSIIADCIKTLVRVDAMSASDGASFLRSWRDLRQAGHKGTAIPREETTALDRWLHEHRTSASSDSLAVPLGGPPLMVPRGR